MQAFSVSDRDKSQDFDDPSNDRKCTFTRVENQIEEDYPRDAIFDEGVRRLECRQVAKEILSTYSRSWKMVFDLDQQSGS